MNMNNSLKFSTKNSCIDNEIIECVGELLNKIEIENTCCCSKENVIVRDERCLLFNRDFEKTMAFWKNASKSSITSNFHQMRPVKKKAPNDKVDSIRRNIEENNRHQLKSRCTRVNAGQLDISLQKSTVILKKRIFSVETNDNNNNQTPMHKHNNYGIKIKNKNTNNNNSSKSSNGSTGSYYRKKACLRFLLETMMKLSKDKKTVIQLNCGLSWILSTSSIFDNPLFLAYLKRAIKKTSLVYSKNKFPLYDTSSELD